MSSHWRRYLMGMGLFLMIGSNLWAEDYHKATFAGGCFWCLQPFYDRLEGVISTTVGYTGGQEVNPTYQQVSTGQTGHAEAIEIIYDSKRVSYEKLLSMYWRNIDPTATNASFYDQGPQYRSVIFYHDETQRQMAQQSKEELEKSGRFRQPIVTQIELAQVFYPAEEYHQQYYRKKPAAYQQYHRASGREEFFKKIWEK